MPVMMSSAAVLAKTFRATRKPFRARAKTVRLPVGIAVRLQPGIPFVFTSESFSRSPRNPFPVAPESAANFAARDFSSICGAKGIYQQLSTLVGLRRFPRRRLGAAADDFGGANTNSEIFSPYAAAVFAMAGMGVNWLSCSCISEKLLDVRAVKSENGMKLAAAGRVAPPRTCRRMVRSRPPHSPDS